MAFHSRRRFLQLRGRPCLSGGLLIAILLLAACRSAKPTPSPSVATGTPSTPVAAPTRSQATAAPAHTPLPASRLQVERAELQGLKVQFWHTWSGTAGQALQNLVADFNASNEWGLQVQPVLVSNYDALDERVQAALQAGTPPDLVAALVYQAAAWDGSGLPAGGEAAQPTGSVETATASATASTPALKSGGRGIATPTRAHGSTASATPSTARPGTSAPAGTAVATPAATGASPRIPAEVVVNLDDYVNDTTWGLLAGDQADFYPAFWQADALGGKRLGLPAVRSAQVLYYNATWAQALGFLEPPVTPAQFQRQACAAAQANQKDTDPENDGTGGWIISTEPAAVTGWLHAFGAEFARPDGSGYRFDTQQAEAALRFLRGLYDAGCAWLPESDPPEAEFARRQGLFAAGSLAGLAHQGQVFERAGSRDQWTVLPFPSPDGQPAVSAYGPSYIILRTTPARQLATWLFVKWLAQPENGAALARAAAALPVRRSAAEQLSAASSGTSQGAAALNLLPYARQEPAGGSWGTVRWAISDAAVQLFRYYFTVDQVPALANLLDETAQELYTRSR